MKGFWKTFLSNLLVVVSLVPMVLMLGALTEMIPNPILWLVIGIISLAGISYLMYKSNEKE